MRLALALAVLAIMAPTRAAAAPPPPDLDAVVTYETRHVLASGVVREERWQERLVRRGDVVWSERILPPAAAAAHRHESAAEHAGHKHFDFEVASRLVGRGADGQTVLRYVDAVHRVVVGVPAAEYGAVGFDGRWDAAAHLVPPQVVASMQGLAGRAPSAGTRWVGERASAWTHKVLWSDRHQVALRIESSRDDGSFRRVVTVAPARGNASGRPPWLGIEGWTQKEYDDFMD
jgi:hypothetical protein